MEHGGSPSSVAIPADGVVLRGDLDLPPGATGLVMFAHGSGSSRLSPRNRYVAATLREAALGTLLLDLLTGEEEAIDRRTAELRFDIPLLAERLSAATDWANHNPATRGLPIGYFGASTGAAAALIAATSHPEVAAIVSRGGRPDLALPVLDRVRAPTLLIAGGRDEPVIEMNQQALSRLRAAELRIVPGATHLFEEEGALEQVADMAREWFARHFAAGSTAPPPEREAPLS